MTTSTQTSALGTPTAPRSSRRWLALSVLALAQFLVVLDASIVNIALPTLGRQLRMDAAALAWVVTAYVLAFGGLLLLGGRLADRYGHRRVFLIGVGGFVAASAIAGLSVSSGMLLAARAVQGGSAALLAPAALALLTHLFPNDAERTKALGVWGGVAGIGSAAGVLLGGVLTSALGWQSVFFVNVPIGALVLVAIPFLVTRDRPGLRGRLDPAGAVTITIALVSAVGALSAVERVGFVHPLTISLAAAAIGFAIVFVLVERRTADPLVPLAIFRNRNLSAANVVMILVGAAMVALFFALSIYLQSVLHYDALTAGLSQLPLAGALVIVAGVVPTVIGRVGSRATLIGSLVVLAAGLGWLAFSPADADYVTRILGPTVLIGIGMGGAFVTTTQLAVHGVAGGESGLAGGLINTSQQIGGALGLALLSAVATLRTHSLRSAGVPEPEAVTGGFSWLYIGAAVVALLAVIATWLTRPARR